jgi:hypothetical protein
MGNAGAFEESSEMGIQQDREQLLLELINRARLDPAAEAARSGLADLSAGTTPAQRMAAAGYTSAASFGYGTGENLATSGLDVIFTDQGETITFHDTKLAEVQATNWFVV